MAIASIVSEALPHLKFAQYEVVPHPDDPSKKLLVHISPRAITSWHRPMIEGVYQGQTDQKPPNGQEYRMSGDDYLLLGYKGLPKAIDHQQLDALLTKTRDWIETNRPDLIAFDR